MFLRPGSNGKAGRLAATGLGSCGEGGIRTPVTREGKAVFKTAAFDRSATSPWAAKVGCQPATIFDHMPAVQLEFLGTGTSQGVPVIGCTCAVCISSDPMDKRLRASALVRTGDATLLIDAGPDLRQQMLRARVDRLDAVLLTHEHMDHVAGIDDLRAFNFKQQRAMDIHGNAATLHAVKRLYHYAFEEVKYPGVPELCLHPIEQPAFTAGGVHVEPIEVMHDRMPVLGFRIGGMAYITDAKTMADEEIRKVQGVDVLVLNALRLKPHPSHLNLAEALLLVERIAPKRAYFTHISHLLGCHAEVAATLPPSVHLAHDGLVVEVPA